MHTMWSRAGVRHCVSVVGQITDDHARLQEMMLGDVNSDQLEALLERLKGIFDIVRLVDPESTKVLSLGKDGRLTEMPGTCHMVWNKSGRCENCISSKALARKESLNKIEFKDDQAYFVMASMWKWADAAACWKWCPSFRTDAGWIWAAAGCCWTAAPTLTAAPLWIR